MIYLFFIHTFIIAFLAAACKPRRKKSYMKRDIPIDVGHGKMFPKRSKIFPLTFFAGWAILLSEYVKTERRAVHDLVFQP